MSLQTRNPVRVVGGNMQSGFPATGEQQMTKGGMQSYWSQSGVGAATLIFSGTGRLNSVIVTNQIQSGRGVMFIDSHIATSGMPFNTSGHKVIGIIPDYQLVGGGSGTAVLNPHAYPGAILEPGSPFFSGLVAAPLASGTGSFMCSFTPETVPLSGPQQLV